MQVSTNHLHLLIKYVYHTEKYVSYIFPTSPGNEVPDTVCSDPLSSVRP